MIKRTNQTVNFAWMGLWLLLTALFAFFLPGFSEFDASKYVSISKEMMTNHQYILAFWDGHPYSDKPPLLFWLFIGGWKVFGVSTWWPQTLVMFITLTSMWMTQRLSLVLWPNRFDIARLVPFILLGCFYWIWFARQVRVDSLLVLATVLAVYFLVNTLQSSKKAWLGYLLAVGLGGFAKGPVLLVFILLPALCLPFLKIQKQKFSPSWFAYLVLTTLIGMALPLLWAIPAALQGGDAFTQEIFYKQISHRQQDYHTSFFFYLERLWMWLLPWTLYPPVYKNLKKLRLFHPTSADTLCLLLLVVGVIVFSVFSQKLPHYLYPLFPFFALLIARLCMESKVASRIYQWPLASVVLLLGVFCLSLPFFFNYLPAQLYIRLYFLNEINLTPWGIGFVALSLALFVVKFKKITWQMGSMALATLMISVFVNSVVLSNYEKHLDNKTVLQFLLHTELSVLARGEFTDTALADLVKQKQLQKTNPLKSKLILTQQVSYLKNAHPLVWYYASRLSIVGVYR